MRILQWQVPADYELILFGDNQEGNVLQYRKGYDDCLMYVLDAPNRYAIHMGDEMEAYWIDDPRYSPYTLQSSPLEQQQEVINNLSLLASEKRLISILYGNHSHKLFPKVGDITASTCERLNKEHGGNVRYGGFSCTVTFEDKFGPQFKGFFTHGRKLIRSIADDPLRREANEQLQLKQHLKNKFGDCLLCCKGHTHRLIIAPPKSQLYLTTELGENEAMIKQHYTHSPAFGNGEYLHPDQRWYVNSGSFLKTFGENISSYSEIGEYDPIELGWAVVEVHDRNITNIRKVVV